MTTSRFFVEEKEVNLIFDMSNMLHKTFYSSATRDLDTAAGMAMHVALTTLMSYYKKFNPTKVVMAFDRHSWRKDYTASEACISKVPYKGTRRQNQTPAQREKYQEFKAHVNEMEALIRDHSTVIVLAEDGLEADDCIAGWVESHSDQINIIISEDSDLWQIIAYGDNVRCISPATKKDADLTEYQNDPNYYLFQKIFRGDLQTDNIPSAYPRVRKTKLEQAYKDDYVMVELLEHEWDDHDGRKMKTSERFQENKLLIDLKAQPADIRELMFAVIAAAEEASIGKRFSLFHFLKFCGKHQLKNIQDNIEKYAPMLSA